MIFLRMIKVGCCMHEFGKGNFLGLTTKNLFVYIIKNNKTTENKTIEFLIIYEFSKWNDMPVLHVQTPEIANSVDRESWHSGTRPVYFHDQPLLLLSPSWRTLRASPTMRGIFRWTFDRAQGEEEREEKTTA